MFDKIKLRLKQWGILIIISFWTVLYTTYFPIYTLYRSIRFMYLKMYYYVQKAMTKSDRIVVDRTTLDTDIDLATISIIQSLLDTVQVGKKEIQKDDESIE